MPQLWQPITLYDVTEAAEHVFKFFFTPFNTVKGSGKSHLSS